MIDFGYLYKGVCGLANAHRAGTMAGHLGAAVAAGYLFGEDQSDWPEEVYRGMQGELERVIAGEEGFWFNAKKAGVTPSELFTPLPLGESDENSIASIVAALESNVGSLRQSGHNIIFASIAVRALHDHPDYATSQVVDGICKLIAAFDGETAGRGYYGKQTGWMAGEKVDLEPHDGFAEYSSIQDMVDTTIAEMIATAAIRKQGFGGLWHIINHAAAITELNRFGYKEMAQKALPAHHQHIRLWRTLPDVASELGAVEKSAHDPREAVYWQGMLKRDEARLTHRIKTLYGFYTLRRFIEEDSTRTRADEAFLYLMA